MRVGVLGVGTATVTVGGSSYDVTLDSESDDIGGDFLRPPGWQTDVVLAGPDGAGGRPDARRLGRARAGRRADPTDRRRGDRGRRRRGGGADVAVVVVGLTEEQETEAFDKSTLALPGRQDELVSAVAAAARRTVVVVNAATPVLMPWATRSTRSCGPGCPARRAATPSPPRCSATSSRPVAWSPRSPPPTARRPRGTSSRPTGSWPTRRASSSATAGYAAGGPPAPAYWFGQGLGYGEWEYGEVALTASSRDRSSPWTLTNVSARDSREVVQVYLQPAEDDQPIRLVGWTTVDARGRGERAPSRSPATRAPAAPGTDGAWRPLTGGRLLVARGLGDIRGEVALPTADLESFIDNLVGRPLDEVSPAATDAGWLVRPYSPGSKLTMDYREDRTEPRARGRRGDAGLGRLTPAAPTTPGPTAARRWRGWCSCWWTVSSRRISWRRSAGWTASCTADPGTEPWSGGSARPIVLGTSS